MAWHGSQNGQNSWTADLVLISGQPAVGMKVKANVSNTS